MIMTKFLTSAAAILLVTGCNQQLHEKPSYTTAIDPQTGEGVAVIVRDATRSMSVAVGDNIPLKKIGENIRTIKQEDYYAIFSSLYVGHANAIASQAKTMFADTNTQKKIVTIYNEARTESIEGKNIQAIDTLGTYALR